MREIISVSLKNKSGLIKCAPHIFKLIREKFSVPNPSFQTRRFSPRRYIITPSGAFEIGLWEEIRSYISSMAIPVELKISPEFLEKFSPKFPAYDIQNIDGFNYYDHQKNTIEEFLKNGRGIGVLATSAGKSVLIAGLLKTILHYNPDFKILIIVPNTGLVSQLYYSFLNEFNMPIVERWGDGYIPKWDKNIIIANNQILYSDIKYTISQVKDFDVVVVDEVHRLGEKKNQINKVVHNITTPHKFGLTGTLPDNYMAAWNIIGKIGPILYEETSYELRKKGVASEVEIDVILCKHTTQPEKVPQSDKFDPTAKYRKEQQFLYKHSLRNKIIEKIAANTKGNTLILVDVIEHGDHLLQSLKDNIPEKQIYFVKGSVDTDDRKIITDLMEEQDNMVVVAMSQIFSTGISVNNLPFIIFSCIGKGVIKISQSIGRSMRLHKNKIKSTIYDIADDTEYSFNHLRQRLKLYKKQQIAFKIKKITI